MTIKLVQSGGFIAITKEAETEVDWTEKEIEGLIKQIEIPGQEVPAARDGIYYTLVIHNKEVTVDPGKAAGKYSEAFSRLKKNLRIIKN